MKKFPKLIITILSLLILSGCWSSIELNDRAFITLMILDLNEDGEVEVTLGLPLTKNMIPGELSSAVSEGGSFAYFSRKAKTIEEALHIIQRDLSRKITFGQNRNIIVGRKYAENSIVSILEFASRNPLIRLNTNLFFVDGYAKEKVSNATVVTERFFVTELNGYMNNDNILQTSVSDMLSSQHSGGDGVIPILDFKHVNTGPLEKLPPALTTGGGVIFRQGKLIEIITPTQMTALKSICNCSRLTQDYFSIASPTDGNDMGFLSSAISLKTKIYRKEDGIHIELQPTANVTIVSSNSDIDITDQKNVGLLESEIEKYSTREIQSAINLIQKSKADALHFDRYILVNYPDEWEKIKDDWRTYYSEQLKIEAKPVIYLKGGGSTARSVKNVFIDDEEYKEK